MKFPQQKIAKSLAWNSEYEWFVGPYHLRDNLKQVTKGTNELARCLWDDSLRIFAWEKKVTETHVFVDIEFYPRNHFIIVEEEPHGRVMASCRRVAQTVRKLYEISKDDTEVAFNHYNVEYDGGECHLLDLVDFLCMVYLRNRDPNLLKLIHEDFGLALSPMGIWFNDDENSGALQLFREKFNEDWDGRRYIHGSPKDAWDRPRLDQLVRTEDDYSHSRTDED